MLYYIQKEREVRTMKKITVYLDMDGTIANLYNQPNWLDRLLAEDETPFTECEPMTTEENLFRLFPKDRYEIKVLTMTPKNATKEYCEKVIIAKENWLNRFFPNITTRIYKPYGNNKNLANAHRHILIDDNAEIRKNFKGLAINPTELW
jgi:5'(3')-deoxyribonucleotidase